MERRVGIKARLARAREKARGDSLNLTMDWRTLAALADAARERFEAEGTEASKERYLSLMEAMSPIIGVREAQDFRERHRALVGKLAPRSEAERALADPPSLKPDKGALEQLADVFHLADYRAADPDPVGDPEWLEPDEPTRLGPVERPRERVAVVNE